MTYKLIALDIDGTIRSMDRPISNRTRRIVEQVSNSDGDAVVWKIRQVLPDVVLQGYDTILQE